MRVVFRALVASILGYICRGRTLAVGSWKVEKFFFKDALNSFFVRLGKSLIVSKFRSLRSVRNSKLCEAKLCPWSCGLVQWPSSLRLYYYQMMPY